MKTFYALLQMTTFVWAIVTEDHWGLLHAADQH